VRRLTGSAAVLAATVLLVLAGLTGCAAYPASPAAAAPVKTKEALREPPQYVSRGGLLRTQIVVERHRVELAGRRLWALTYNGFYMPPTLRIQPGDRMDLTLVNHVHPYTNLHLHGLHISPVGHSDNIFLHINPGQTFHYRYRFPLSLTPGTYWYHSHAHPYAAPQVAGGMSGLIIVDGLRQYLPARLRGITEHTIALKDFQLHADTVRTKNLHISSPTHRTVNGQTDPIIRIRPGETQLWRIANISANIYYVIHMDGYRFHVLARDGSPVRRVWSRGSLLVPAAARFDVLVQGGPAGTTKLETLPYNTGPAGNQFPRATLATLVSAGRPVPTAQLPTDIAPFEDLTDQPIAVRRTLVFSERGSGPTERYLINGRTFNERRVDTRARLNTVEEWTIRNHSREEHTFHIHTNKFQLMSINGHPHHALNRQDTANLPAGTNGVIVIRIHFTDYTGKTVYHCHILNHEDGGMMGVLEIVK
jgi:FtsP/CotA-like multicopper oxidase with cupredoxin domain